MTEDKKFAELFAKSIEAQTTEEKKSRKAPPMGALNPPLADSQSRRAAPPDDGGDDDEWSQCLLYAANGVDKRKVKRDLSGGSKIYPPEDELEVRGMTIAEAHSELFSFLQAAQARGCRCVEVIHGRGHNSPGGKALLRAKTRKWLAGCDAVLAFIEIPQNPGGVRALLRRK
jgi:DNA-nicking Smr family endonuclease